jgi:hypothetical protein
MLKEFNYKTINKDTKFGSEDIKKPRICRAFSEIFLGRLKGLEPSTLRTTI